MNTDWTADEIDKLHEAERNMDNVMSEPSSTWREIEEAINNFFDKW